MDTMVEIVAEAMEVKRRELIHRPLATIWEELAVTAIDAMRRPQGGMLAAGAVGSGDGDMALARGVWEAMIDFALIDR